MSKWTGVSMALFVGKDELDAAKNGGSMMVASEGKTAKQRYQIFVPIEACDIMDTEVRVNLTKLASDRDEALKNMGDVVGNAMSQAFEPMLKLLQDA